MKKKRLLEGITKCFFFGSQRVETTIDGLVPVMFQFVVFGAQLVDVSQVISQYIVKFAKNNLSTRDY